MVRRGVKTSSVVLLPLLIGLAVCAESIVLMTLVNGFGENVLTGRFLWLGIGLGYMPLNATSEESD